MESFSAKARPRVRSTSISDGSSATAGTIFTRVTKWVNSARSVSTTAGSAPVSYCSRSSASAAAISPRINASNRSMHARAVGKPQHLPHVLGLHRSGGVRDGLIQQRKRVAHRAFRGARDQRERLGLDLRSPPCSRSPARCVTSRPASTRRRSKRWQRERMVIGTLRISVVAKDELGVRRRLFQRLEQRVEGLRREHVHFVENIDLVARADRSVADRVVDLAHVIDAVVRGGVHFDDVDMPALHDCLAMHADGRHPDRRAGDGAVGQLVVERAREDARGRRLADAAHAGEDPGLRDAGGLERVRDRAHHGVLADQVVEGRGTILARKHAVGAVARRPAPRPGSG